jgi:peptidoglycan/LPS O-acetylase OafA/YrhL
MISNKVRFHKLDGLRGVLSLLIVLFHYDSLLKPLLIKNSVFVLYGDTAVDYFFVLSGFVLCHRYYDVKLIEIGLFKFMKLRLVRIYPLLFYTTLVYFIVEASVPFIFPGLMSSPNSINDNFKMLTETLLLLNSSPILGIGNGMNYPSWSISAEMISYFIFAITIIGFSKFKYYYKYIYLVLSLVFMLALLKLNGNMMSTGSYGFLRSFFGFSFGVVVYFLSLSVNKIPKYFEIIVIILLISYFYLIDFNRFALYFAVPVFGFSILILVKTDFILSKVLESRYLQYLGVKSYSIYLNHALFILIIPKFLSIFFSSEDEIIKYIIMIFTITITIIYSHFTHILIENRIGLILKKILKV